MNALVQSVRPTGGIGVVGVFVPEDRKAADKMAKKGQIAFDLGEFFSRGQHLGIGGMKPTLRPTTVTSQALYTSAVPSPHG